MIDDKKARRIVESIGVKCVGTLGLLAASKDKGTIKELKPIFEALLKNNRYYSIDLLNDILEKYGENKISKVKRH